MSLEVLNPKFSKRHSYLFVDIFINSFGKQRNKKKKKKKNTPWDIDGDWNSIRERNDLLSLF
jgi:hypothetical protein